MGASYFLSTGFPGASSSPHQPLKAILLLPLRSFFCSHLQWGLVKGEMKNFIIISNSSGCGCHQRIRFKEERWWIVNVYEEMAAIIMMATKREVKRLAHWDVSPSPGWWWRGSSGLGRYHYTKIDGVSYPAALADSLFFFRTMSCGTRFASFTLSEQLFLMLSYFSCRVENCWNQWLENLNCIHSWHWNWQIASFPHWNGKFITLRCRHAMQAGGMGCPHFILV